jgi:hypothetical protein
LTTNSLSENYPEQIDDWGDVPFPVRGQNPGGQEPWPPSKRVAMFSVAIVETPDSTTQLPRE